MYSYVYDRPKWDKKGLIGSSELVKTEKYTRVNQKNFLRNSMTKLVKYSLFLLSHRRNKNVLDLFQNRIL